MSLWDPLILVMTASKSQDTYPEGILTLDDQQSRNSTCTLACELVYAWVRIIHEPEEALLYAKRRLAPQRMHRSQGR